MKPAERVLWGFLCFALAMVLIPTIIVAAFDKSAEYSAAVAAGGLDVDAAAATGASLVVPALFNLTVHIRNPGRLFSECVKSGTTAAVSYNGVKVGEGAVPEFCARKRAEREVVVPVWAAAGGEASRLVLPAPGELQRPGAVVDVAIRTPRARVYRHGLTSDQTLACSVKVGGGLSRCKKELS